MISGSSLRLIMWTFQKFANWGSKLEVSRPENLRPIIESKIKFLIPNKGKQLKIPTPTNNHYFQN